MTKQKKVIWIILGIIIFVFSVFLGLGYLGQITGGNSLIQRTEMNDKYVPEEITKYYPIEDLNSKESLLSDKNYANSRLTVRSINEYRRFSRLFRQYETK